MNNEVREEIMFFAQEMERIMKKCDKVKGDSWKDMSHEELQKLLLKEVKESEDENATIKEWIDIANVCMMIYCNTLHFRG